MKPKFNMPPPAALMGQHYADSGEQVPPRSIEELWRHIEQLHRQNTRILWCMIGFRVAFILSVLVICYYLS